MREAARQANALEFIERFPDGFDTVIGEGGVALSGGQRCVCAPWRAWDGMAGMGNRARSTLGLGLRWRIEIDRVALSPKNTQKATAGHRARHPQGLPRAHPRRGHLRCVRAFCL